MTFYRGVKIELSEDYYKVAANIYINKIPYKNLDKAVDWKPVKPFKITDEYSYGNSKNINVRRLIKENEPENYRIAFMRNVTMKYKDGTLVNFNVTFNDKTIWKSKNGFLKNYIDLFAVFSEIIFEITDKPDIPDIPDNPDIEIDCELGFVTHEMFYFISDTEFTYPSIEGIAICKFGVFVNAVIGMNKRENPYWTELYKIDKDIASEWYNIRKQYYLNEEISKKFYVNRPKVEIDTKALLVKGTIIDELNPIYESFPYHSIKVGKTDSWSRFSKIFNVDIENLVVAEKYLNEHGYNISKTDVCKIPVNTKETIDKLMEEVKNYIDKYRIFVEYEKNLHREKFSHCLDELTFRPDFGIDFYRSKEHFSEILQEKISEYLNV